MSYWICQLVILDQTIKMYHKSWHILRDKWAISFLLILGLVTVLFLKSLKMQRFPKCQIFRKEAGLGASWYVYNHKLCNDSTAYPIGSLAYYVKRNYYFFWQLEQENINAISSFQIERNWNKVSKSVWLNIYYCCRLVFTNMIAKLLNSI